MGKQLCILEPTRTSKSDASLHSDQTMSATTASASTALDANCAPDALVCAVMCVTNAANARRDSDRRGFERERMDLDVSTNTNANTTRLTHVTRRVRWTHAGGISSSDTRCGWKGKALSTRWMGAVSERRRLREVRFARVRLGLRDTRRARRDRRARRWRGRNSQERRRARPGRPGRRRRWC